MLSPFFNSCSSMEARSAPSWHRWERVPGVACHPWTPEEKQALSGGDGEQAQSSG